MTTNLNASPVNLNASTPAGAKQKWQSIAHSAKLIRKNKTRLTMPHFNKTVDSHTNVVVFYQVFSYIAIIVII